MRSRKESDARYDASLKGRYRSAKKMAKQRNISWRLSLKQFEKIVAHPCDYCLGPLGRTGSGLDRVNNKYGYYVANLVPCCGECNQIKSNTLNYIEMKLAASVITTYRKIRKK